MKVDVSGVIPFYNSASTIKQCIDSLLNQSLKLEIIAVGYGIDDSVKIIKKFGRKVKLVEKKCGRSAARNIGAKLASGRILFFVESDAVYPKEYVEKCVGFMEHEKLASTLGVERVWNTETLVARAQDAERVYSAKSRDPFGGWFYRKKEFFQLGGFKGIDVGEDVELANRARKFGGIKWCRETSWFHRYPDTLSKLFKKNYLFGTQLLSFLRETKAAKEHVLKNFYVPAICMFLVFGIFNKWFLLAGLISALPLLARYLRLLFAVRTFDSLFVIVLWVVKSFGKSAGIVASLFMKEKRFNELVRGQK